MRLLADLFRDKFPDVANFLERLRYVDDLANSVKSQEEALKLVKDTEEVLDSVEMKIKGWSITGENPPPELTDEYLLVWVV